MSDGAERSVIGLNEPLRTGAYMPLGDVALPILPNPTITLYRERFIEFNESLKEALDFLVAVTEQERPSRASIVSWVMNGDDEELKERMMKLPWFASTYGVLWAWGTARDTDA